ncbi:3968_t:CDS:2, partial [Gigaspora margarita]
DKDNATLPFRISNGLREKPISDIHHKYAAIYKKCWQGMQDDRPSIQVVAMELKDIIIQDIDVQDISIQDFTNNKLFDIFNINSFVKYLDAHFKTQDVTNNSGEQEIQDKINNSDEQETQDVTNNSDEQEIHDTFNNSDEQETQDVTNNSDEQETQDVAINSDEQETQDITNNSVEQESQEVTNGSEDDDMTIFVNKLYTTFNNLFNEGRSVSEIIINSISDAIEWYTKASQGGCAIAECMLGKYCYKLHKYEQAFKLLNSSADKGNALAMNTLGTCYLKGYGTNVNRVKEFKSFEKATKIGLPASQYELGDCYKYGYGTKISLEMLLYWYQKASEKNSNYLNHVKRVENKIELLRQSSITLN